MNDLLNNNIKPQNLPETFSMLLNVAERLYDTVVPKTVSKRKNKDIFTHTMS